MKKLVALAVGLVLVVGVVMGETPSRIYSRPEALAPEVLHKLNLKIAWKTLVPLDGKRDGIGSVQVLDGQVLVQTRSGALIMLNGETGQTQWITLIGQPYHASIPPSYNDSSVIGLNGTRMFGLERATGQALWEFDLPNAPTAPVAVDSERAYVCITGGRFFVYEMLKQVQPSVPGARPAVQSGPRGSVALVFGIPRGSFVAVAVLRTNPPVAAVCDEVDAIAPRLALAGTHRTRLGAVV